MQDFIQLCDSFLNTTVFLFKVVEGGLNSFTGLSGKAQMLVVFNTTLFISLVSQSVFDPVELDDESNGELHIRLKITEIEVFHGLFSTQMTIRIGFDEHACFLFDYPVGNLFTVFIYFREEKTSITDCKCVKEA